MPAAGIGLRMAEPPGSSRGPKQYEHLAGCRVIEHALRPFIADPRCVGIVVALHENDQDFQSLSVSRDARIQVTTGGAVRALSVLQGLNRVMACVGTQDPWVLVHDAARPLLSADDLTALVDALPSAPHGALLGMRVNDTVKRADEQGRSHGTAARAGLWRAATPQAFRLRRLLQALAGASLETITDEASAIEALGDTPQLISCSLLNFKITTAADLALAARLLTEHKI